METRGIRLGIAISQSGRYAIFGRQALAGVRCFVRDRNAVGGVREPGSGRAVPITLFVEDDRGDEGCVRRSVEKLVRRDRVHLLLGPYGSGLALAAAETAERCEHVLWNHGGSSDEVFERGYRWTVGILSPASRYLVGVVDLLRSLGARSFAVVAARTGFASRVAAAAIDRIRLQGLTLTASRFYQTGTSSFAPLLAEIETDPPEVLLGAGRFEDDLLLGRHLAESKPPIAAVGLVAAGVSEFGRVLGASCDGAFGPTQWEPQARFSVNYGPTAEEFSAGYARSTPLPLDYPAVQAYAAGVLATRCLEQAGSLEQQALRDAAAHLRCTTLFGPFAIDPSSGRQTAHGILITQWLDGSRKIVWPEEFAEVRPRYPAPPGLGSVA
jgi:branched-chain amino acid transport system substrate-binding protein